jgi:hypothetical protein
MKSFFPIVFLLMGLPIVTAPAIVHARYGPAEGAAAGQKEQKSVAIAGEVERAGAQLRLALTNPSDAREFQGSASVAVGASADEVTRLSVTLAPGETRNFPLSVSASPTDQYSLSVYNQAGTLVLYKIAPIKLVGGNEGKPASGKTAAPEKKVKETNVRARLRRAQANPNAELPVAETDDPLLLIFEIETGSPVKDASFSLEGKGFQRRQVVSAETRAALEFKLPEAMIERRLSYSLTAVDGRQIARGEIDLDQLTAADAVSLGSLTFDRPAYAPGESARAVIELQGDSTSGYRLEVTAKDGGGNLLFKNERSGSNSEGKSRQEFLLEIPREAKGPVILSYQIFGAQTGALFDSGERGIILNEPQDEKANAGKRLAP